MLNYLFGWGVACLPFFALRPLSQLPRIPKVLGFVLVSPLLLVCLLMIAVSVACDFDLHPYSKDSCTQELERIEQHGYSVHFILDGCGGASQGFILDVEKRMKALPGIYVFRTVDSFDGAYEGTMRSVGENQIHVHIPMGVPGSGWRQEVDRDYRLKRHVYF